jgi:hypothetical protein
MSIFFAYLTIMGWVALGADAINAYAQTDIPEDEPQYIAVAQQMVDWWWDKFSERITIGMVMQILKALQGHPRAGKLWGDRVEGHLSELSFKPLKHENCLYACTHKGHKGHKIICCRQSDYFLFGGEDETVIRRLIVALGLKVAIKAELGLSTHFNGLEIVQDRDYIHIHVSSYLDNILTNHGWSEEGKQEARHFEPLHPSSVKELETSEGPEDPVAAKAIETASGFDYRTGISEMIFAYVTCRLYIGYAVTELSKFSTKPAAVHYTALKCVFRYLRQTREHGLVYWRRTPCLSLPHVPLKLLHPMDPADQGLSLPDLATTLCAYVDAAHANCLRTRRSVGAFVFCLAGTAVAYRAKWLTTICCSSTKSEFLTAVTAAKMAKFLRWILIELGLHQSTQHVSMKTTWLPS